MRYLLFASAACLLIGASCGVAQQPAPGPINLPVGPETTVVEGPLTADGTIDYFAAINQAWGEAVAPEENAAVGLAEVMAEWPSDTYRQRYFEALGVEPPGKETPKLIPFDDFAAARLPRAEGLAPEWNPFAGEMPVGGPWPSAEAEQSFQEAQDGPWTPEEQPLVAQWLQEIAPALKRVEEAIQKPKYYSPLVSDEAAPVLLEALLPQLGQARQVARAFAARANLRLAQGDVGGAIEDALAVKRLSRLMSDHPTLIGDLVAVSISRVGGGITESIVSHRSLDRDEAERFVQGLQSLAPMRGVAKAVDTGERYMALDWVQQLAAGRLGPDTIGMVGGQAAGMMAGQQKHTLPDRLRSVLGETLEAINVGHDRIVQAIKAGSFEQRLSEIEAYKQEIAVTEAGLQQRFAPGVAAPDQVEAVAETMVQFMLQTAASVTDSSLRTEYQNLALDQLEPLAVALNAYHTEHGRYPDTLDALVPQYFESVPTDPISEEPVKYRLTEGEAVVYSVGTDLEDDGGLENQGASAEGDLVIRLPRR